MSVLEERQKYNYKFYFDFDCVLSVYEGPEASNYDSLPSAS